MRIAVLLTGRHVHGCCGSVLAVESPRPTRRVVEATEVFLLRPSWIEGADGRPHRMLSYRVLRRSDTRRCHRRRAGPVLGCCVGGSIRDLVAAGEFW